MNKTTNIVATHIVNGFASAIRHPLVVGVSGPQGSGKTTLTTSLVQILKNNHNLRAVSFSLDDLYLTFADQIKLRDANPNNPLLEFRGNPGTHDLDLGLAVFHSLTTNTTKTTKIPKYEKALNSGRGDRLNETEWTDAELPIDIILFEGWCLGFKPVLDQKTIKMRVLDSRFGPDFAKFTLENLLVVQNHLAKLDVLHKSIDSFVHICAEDIGFVYDWRQQQEDYMRETLGNPSAGLSTIELRDFISRFMPQYLIGLPELDNGFFEKHNGRHLKITIDKNRDVVSSETF
ncbi:UNVERIFIED_CONTAM: hypothetical protein HDU68_012284 [Siphonaria sp. JEL0065]|nr:hypothetical protein HDU68_012284 [Siphonaria sp. JEL0065]